MWSTSIDEIERGVRQNVNVNMVVHSLHTTHCSPFTIDVRFFAKFIATIITKNNCHAEVIFLFDHPVDLSITGEHY